MTLNKFDDEGIDLTNFNLEEELTKFEDCTAPGWKIFIRLYTGPKKTKSGLYIPDTVHDEQQYRNLVGLVIKLGPDAYKGKRYTTPWCKVGDWVVIPRHAGTRSSFRGMPVFSLNDDALEYVVKNPADVTK